MTKEQYESMKTEYANMKSKMSEYSFLSQSLEYLEKKIEVLDKMDSKEYRLCESTTSAGRDRIEMTLQKYMFDKLRPMVKKIINDEKEEILRKIEAL